MTSVDMITLIQLLPAVDSKKLDDVLLRQFRTALGHKPSNFRTDIVVEAVLLRYSRPKHLRPEVLSYLDRRSSQAAKSLIRLASQL